MENSLFSIDAELEKDWFKDLEMRAKWQYLLDRSFTISVLVVTIWSYLVNHKNIFWMV